MVWVGDESLCFAGFLVEVVDFSLNRGYYVLNLVALSCVAYWWVADLMLNC